MNKNHPLDADLERYSITARTVLNLKPSAKCLGELTLYTAAAGSALALAQSAEASIIYSGIRDITIHRVTNSNVVTAVDLNGDGQNDMLFHIFSQQTSKGGFYELDSAVATGIGQPPTLLLDNQKSSLLKLSASNSLNYKPGANNTWRTLGGLRLHTATSNNTIGRVPLGLWNPGPNATTTGFAGAAFAKTSAGAPHLSWLQFKLTTDSKNRTNSLTLIDWAYQSVPGASIHVGSKGSTSVPEPSTLGLMALGAAGITALRRRRSQEKNAGQAH
jgi:hypothetical protein